MGSKVVHSYPKSHLCIYSVQRVPAAWIELRFVLYYSRRKKLLEPYSMRVCAHGSGITSQRWKAPQGVVGCLAACAPPKPPSPHPSIATNQEQWQNIWNIYQPPQRNPCWEWLILLYHGDNNWDPNLPYSFKCFLQASWIWSISRSQHSTPPLIICKLLLNHTIIIPVGHF